MNRSSPPPWLRTIVHADFVAAVALTVLAPLALLARAATRRPAQLPIMLRYWRVSALLMVTVYLLAGRRTHAHAAGVAARLLIAQTLTDADPTGDPLFEHWRRSTAIYCMAGAAANVPLLLPLGSIGATLRNAYAEPPDRYANVLHPHVTPAALGRIGDYGLAAYSAGALMIMILRKKIN